VVSVRNPLPRTRASSRAASSPRSAAPAAIARWQAVSLRAFRESTAPADGGDERQPRSSPTSAWRTNPQGS
jgi:hypothetical protein